jgi:hypothetical protein
MLFITYMSVQLRSNLSAHILQWLARIDDRKSMRVPVGKRQVTIPDPPIEIQRLVIHAIAFAT